MYIYMCIYVTYNFHSSIEQFIDRRSFSNSFHKEQRGKLGRPRPDNTLSRPWISRLRNFVYVFQWVLRRRNSIRDRIGETFLLYSPPHP